MKEDLCIRSRLSQSTSEGKSAIYLKHRDYQPVAPVWCVLDAATQSVFTIADRNQCIGCILIPPTSLTSRFLSSSSSSTLKLSLSIASHLPRGNTTGCLTLSVSGRGRVTCSRRTSRVGTVRLERKREQYDSGPCTEGQPLILPLLVDHGMPSMATYLVHYKVGDIVDIKANASEQKGLPHKCKCFSKGFTSLFPLHQLKLCLRSVWSPRIIFPSAHQAVAGWLDR